ncbi:ATP-binding protein [Patescibacteria group bacterium]|nr:ATP-binding protein [Patescibacteria group bacterium]
MDDYTLLKTIEFYNPHIKNIDYLLDIPVFRRNVYSTILENLDSIKQIISITGPRRVGKTTILKQLIFDLSKQSDISPSNILYISMDDPYILSRDPNTVFDDIIALYSKYILKKKIGSEKIYFFIDEIHKFPGWELFLKKYYDKGMNIRFVISGSVSSSILSKSRESLAGRIKDFKIYPFSFYEFVEFNVFSNDLLGTSFRENILKILSSIHEVYFSFENMNFLEVFSKFRDIMVDMTLFEDELFSLFYKYLTIGGFIEGWEIHGRGLQYEYLYQTQIEKVLLQDIYILEDIKNTSQLSNLFFQLSSNFGDEISLNSLKKEMSLHRETLERYIKLLTNSNLIVPINKFRENINKSSNIKIFLIDIGIRNSIFKIREEEILSDTVLFSKYISNIVLISLLQKFDRSSIEYYRDREKKIDFIINGINGLTSCNIGFSRNFGSLSSKLKIDKRIIIDTKFALDYKDEILTIPYILFLLMF